MPAIAQYETYLVNMVELALLVIAMVAVLAIAMAWLRRSTPPPRPTQRPVGPYRVIPR